LRHQEAARQPLAQAAIRGPRQELARGREGELAQLGGGIFIKIARAGMGAKPVYYFV
jgi:hypothetical protein